jgi:hypothetical protein
MNTPPASNAHTVRITTSMTALQPLLRYACIGIS